MEINLHSLNSLHPLSRTRRETNLARKNRILARVDADERAIEFAHHRFGNPHGQLAAGLTRFAVKKLVAK
jgi:hypothetical protein